MPESRLIRPASRPLVTILVDGHEIEAGDGESLATALVSAGMAAGRSPRMGSPRGPWCMIGLCRQCLATVDGKTGVRTCRVAVAAGMRVET